MLELCALLWQLVVDMGGLPRAGAMPASMLAGSSLRSVCFAGVGVGVELGRVVFEGSVVPLEGRESCFIAVSSRPAACFARRLLRLWRMPRPYCSLGRSDSMVACSVTFCC